MFQSYQNLSKVFKLWLSGVECQQDAMTPRPPLLCYGFKPNTFRLPLKAYGWRHQPHQHKTWWLGAKLKVTHAQFKRFDPRFCFEIERALIG